MRAGLLRDKIVWKKQTKINNKGVVSYSYKEKSLKVYVLRGSGRKTVVNNETFTSTDITFKCRNHYDFSNSDLFEYNDDEYVVNSIFPTIDSKWLEVSISKKNN